MSEEELIQHCEKQIMLCEALGDSKHCLEHQLILNIIQQRDLYKSVIDELNKFVEENYFHFDSYTGDGDYWLGEEQCFKLKEILDKINNRAKVGDNNE